MAKYGFAKGYALFSYERLILSQPDIAFQGLWHKDGIYYIGCRDLDTALSSDGTPISKWFDKNCRVMGYQVALIKDPPINSERVPARTPEQISLLHGEPFNFLQFFGEVKRQLPKDFPEFSIDDSPETITFLTKSKITQEQKLLAEIAIANLGIDINVKFKVDLNARKPEPVEVILGQPNKLESWPKTLTDLYDESEQLWFDNRLHLFSDEDHKPSYYGPPIDRSEAACYIDCTFGTPSNIRNYLTTYNKIYITPPPNDFEKTITDLKISQKEFCMLLENGRIQIVLPYELNKYEAKSMARYLEASEGSSIFHRQLAAASLNDGRNRNPLMYPRLDNEARRLLLDKINLDQDKADFALLRVARDHFGASWTALEFDYSEYGASAALNHGMGKLLAGLISKVSGRELDPVLLQCATTVEWSSALNANYCPTEITGFNLEPRAELAASFINGIPNKTYIDTTPRMDTIINEMLVLDNDAPITEVLDAFNPNDIKRLNEILKSCNYDQEATSKYVSALNEKIKHFDRIQKKVKKRDLLTAMAALTSPITTIPYLSWVPAGLYIAQRILNHEDREGSHVTDWLKAKNARTTSEAVFLSRMRKYD